MTHVDCELFVYSNKLQPLIKSNLEVDELREYNYYLSTLVGGQCLNGSLKTDWVEENKWYQNQLLDFF